MDIKFQIARADQDFGQLTVSEIKQKLAAGELKLTDYVFDSQKQDWVFLLECQEIAAALKADKPRLGPKPTEVKVETKKSTKAEPTRTEKKLTAVPSAKPTTATVSTLTNMEASGGSLIDGWFLLKGETKLGPLQFADLVRMLQQKVSFEFEWAWHPSMTDWKRIAEIPQFSKSAIENWMKTLSSTEHIFHNRRSPRWPISAEVFIHDQRQVWTGEGIQLSLHGAGLNVKNPFFLPGQQVTVHFCKSETLPAFNTKVEIVSKKFTPIKSRNSNVEYGVLFLTLTDEIRNKVKGWMSDHQKMVA